MKVSGIFVSLSPQPQRLRELVPELLFLLNLFLGYIPRDTQNAQDAVKAYMKVAKKHGLDMCQMVLAFVNSRPFVTSNIIGATTMEQLKSNIASKDIILSEDVLKDIETVRRQFQMVY